MMAINQQYYFILSFNYVIARSMLIEFLECLMVLKIILWHFSPCSSEVLLNDTRTDMLHLPSLECFIFQWGWSVFNANIEQFSLRPQGTEQVAFPPSHTAQFLPCPALWIQILLHLPQPSCFQLDFIISASARPLWGPHWLVLVLVLQEIRFSPLINLFKWTIK